MISFRSLIKVLHGVKSRDEVSEILQKIRALIYLVNGQFQNQ